jgi:predicted transcriptional regulator of viral defense system
MDGQLQTHPDRLIAELAGRQHGVVSREQLAASGLSPDAIDGRVRRGRLHIVCRGVYAVGHRRLTHKGRWMAAVLTARDDAVLSDRAGAELWRLLPISGRLDVTVPRVLRDRDGIRFHCCRLQADEITRNDGIPVTTVARTLLDLAGTGDARLFERALNEAEYRRLYDAVGLSMLLARYPRRPGVPLVRSMLGRMLGITRRELEERFVAFVDRYRLPRPERNAWIELAPGRWIEADCLWREARLIVELDSRSAHDTSSRFDSDRERDRLLAVAGWRVVRVTWAHLRDAPARLAADLRALLSV